MPLNDLNRGWYVTSIGIPFWVLLLLFLSILENLTLSISAEINLSGYSLFKNHDFILPLVFLIRAQPTNTQSLSKDYRSFGVDWISRQVMEILMAISRFYIQICNNVTAFNTNFRVNKCNAFFAWLISKFHVSIELIKATQKSLKFLVTMCSDKINIVNISNSHQRL